MASTDTLIIGAGLAGLSCALHHDGEAHIVEACDWVGGKARSEQREGFTFDVTGHWLHLRDPEMRRLVLETCGADHFVEITRRSRIWSHGVYTRYPFQANTYGLPPDIIHECVMGAIEAAEGRPEEVALEDEPENFADWIRFYFGEGIAKHFMVPYNAKLWGVKAEEITSRWCQRFVPRPKVTDIVAGAVGCNEKAMGYNARFLYPRSGGIQSMAEKLADRTGRERIDLGCTVERISLSERRAWLSDGRTFDFERLVSTMALPVLIDLIDEVPEDVREARKRLRATETVYMNVAVDAVLGQDDHWIYVPEERFPMYRVGSFSNAWHGMAPEGCASLYVELSDRETAPEQLEPLVAEGLVEMGLIEHTGQVRFMETRRIPNAYVVFDFNYHDSRERVLSWLAEQGVQSIGRYGDWNYSSMEDALLMGRAAAARLEAGHS